jgi:2-polyprenyl-3-methyl-5-hydroxy-6-metoxy-1,4-benzoquinol methylase
MNCPIDDSPTHRSFKKDGYWIRECPKCHFEHVEILKSRPHYAKVYGDHYFFGGGAGYTDYYSEGDILMAHGYRYGQILSNFMQPGKVLDVGAAAGFLLKGLIGRGWTGVGLEPNNIMADYGPAQLGVNVSVGILEHFKSDEMFDLVTMIQVVAHFLELKRALQVAADLTKPSGYWLIETWNKSSFIAQMLGRNWHEYSPPSVLSFFSPKTLGLLVQQYGFKEVARGRPKKRIKSGHVKSLLHYKLGHSILLKPSRKLIDFIPDHLTLPYPSFDLFWVLYQKIT